MNVEIVENGVPYWVALNTKDPAAAAKFYCALLGWEAAAAAAKAVMRDVYVLRGLPVAGIGRSTESERPAWRTYVNVADVEEVARKVIAAGGTLVVAPTTVADAGRFVVFADPFGARIAAWQAGELKGAGLIQEPGAYAWSELIIDDVDGAAAFYGAVFGWMLTKPVPGDPLQRREWQVSGRSVAGLLPRPPAMPKEIPPYWDVYFAVSDATAAVANVKRLGGTNLMPPTDIPHGRIAVFTDPGGAVFSVIVPNDVRAGH